MIRYRVRNANNEISNVSSCLTNLLLTLDFFQPLAHIRRSWIEKIGFCHSHDFVYIGRFNSLIHNQSLFSLLLDFVVAQNLFWSRMFHQLHSQSSQTIIRTWQSNVFFKFQNFAQFQNTGKFREVVGNGESTTYQFNYNMQQTTINAFKTLSGSYL